LKLRKLYVDCIAADGSVAVAYVTALEALGGAIAPAGIELYAADGARTIYRGRAPAVLDAAMAPGGAPLAFAIELSGRRCTLELEPEQGAIACPSGMPEGLSWHVRATRARVRLRHLRAPGDELAGTGYADCVTLTRMPRALGLSRLEWGRAHLERGSVVYTWVERAGAPGFCAAMAWPDGAGPIALSQFTLEPGARAGERRLRLPFGARGLELALAPQRELHCGAAVDRARFPSRLERTLSRLFAGPTAERRFVSQADGGELGRGWAVHESVRFGACAAEPFA
jgi:hypothetical protein